MLSVNAVFPGLGVAPYQDADLTLLGFTVGLVAIAAAIFRVPLIDVVPAAREKVFEEPHSPVAVVGRDSLVLDANEAARPLFSEDLTARPADEVLPAAPTDSGLLDGETDETELEVQIDGEERWYLVRPQPFGTGERDAGYVLVFTDVTQRREREQRLDQFA
jgi:PAS domain S-box-containing protein